MAEVVDNHGVDVSGRVPITRPSSGVIPMEVMSDFPPLYAEQPLPK